MAAIVGFCLKFIDLGRSLWSFLSKLRLRKSSWKPMKRLGGRKPMSLSTGQSSKACLGLSQAACGQLASKCTFVTTSALMQQFCKPLRWLRLEGVNVAGVVIVKGNSTGCLQIRQSQRVRRRRRAVQQWPKWWLGSMQQLLFWMGLSSCRREQQGIASRHCDTSLRVETRFPC